MDLRNLIKAVADLLSRFASKKYAVDGALENGVWVQRNDSGKFLFVLTTDDRITVKVLFEADKATKEYMAGMVQGVITMLHDKRKQRQSESVIEIATNEQIEFISGVK